MEFSYILGTNLLDYRHFGTTGAFFFKKHCCRVAKPGYTPGSGPQFIHVFFYLVNFGNVATKKEKKFSFL